MKINWIIANSAVLDPTVKIETLKNVGPLWGSWQTFRSFSTDNVVCYDNTQAQDLVVKGFNRMCNFYVNKSAYPDKAPPGVKLFGGEFEHELNNKDEVVAMHLCSSVADIVLLYGFDWSLNNLNNLGNHYKGLVLDLITKSEVQWVLVDHSRDLSPEFVNLENVNQDSLTNVIKLAG